MIEYLNSFKFVCAAAGVINGVISVNSFYKSAKSGDDYVRLISAGIVVGIGFFYQ